MLPFKIFRHSPHHSTHTLIDVATVSQTETRARVCSYQPANERLPILFHTRVLTGERHAAILAACAQNCRDAAWALIDLGEEAEL